MRTKDEIIEELFRENLFLKERIAELERKLNSNSQNSSKPPSSDGFQKPKTRSLREKGKNKSGGQPKHPGETLYQTNHPDRIVFHKINFCPCCDKDLRKKQSLGFIKRQVFDISVPKIEITEHQAEIKFCAHCNDKTTAAFPTDVMAPVQYGSRVKALSIYLQNQHFIPEARLKMLFKDIFKLPIACATISNFNLNLSSRLSVFLESVYSCIYKAKIKHLDETGLQVATKTHWLHVASTDKFTHYRMGMNRGEVPDKMLGTIVHDHWKSYFCVKKARHAMCNGHILRELKGIIEEDKEIWAKKMYRLLQLACRVKNKFPEDIPRRWKDFISTHYFEIVNTGILFHKSLPPLIQKKQWRPKRRVGHNLLIRLQEYSEETLRFLYDRNVPFTNNQAEQDIRMMKVKQKISGCFRSILGADVFCRIRTLLSTARKQGWNILETIEDALNERIPNLTAG